MAGQALLGILLPTVMLAGEWSAATVAASIGLIVVFWSCLGMGWLGRRRVITAAWLQSGEWLLKLADGRKLVANLRGGSYANSGFMYLRFRVDELVGPTGYRLMLIRGELGPHDWRRLQTRLRLEGARPETSAVTHL